MRARLAVLALLMALPPLLSGCGPGRAPSGNSGDGVTVDIATAENPTTNAGSAPPEPAIAPQPKPPAAVPPPAKPEPKPKTATKPAEPDKPKAEEVASASQPAKPEEPAEASARPAKLPLPDTVVARTIERIGYACGQVTSSSAVSGDGGPAYKVTCSSGASYRASTIAGHLRFRKWDGR